MSTEEKKSRDPLYITIIVLLLAGSSFLGYSWYTQKQDLEKCQNENDSLFMEREELRKMLEGNGMIDLASANLKDNLQLMLDELSHVQTANDTMQAKIAQQEEKIRGLMEEAQKHKGDAYVIMKLRRESETLRRIMRSYVHTIDSLNTLNQTLQAEIKVKDGQIKDVTSERDDALDKNKNLEEKVARGSILQTSGLTATAIRIRNSGKQVETTRAGKADMIKACMTIMENKIAKSGAKDIYMVVITPGGTVITGDPSITVNTDEGSMPYSLKREIDYQNAQLDLCMYAEIKDDLKAGAYIVKVYCEKALIGKSTFTLK